MKQIVFALLVLIGLCGCTGENPYYPFMDSLLTPSENVELVAIKNLPKDKNGFYYFQLYNQTGQNLQTLTGSIRINGKVPDNPRVKVDWENNLYWHLRKGDIVATITKTYLNKFTGQFTIVQLPPLINNIDALVPTINKTCYNSLDGSINTVIAPIWEMRGDTMQVVVKYNKTTKIERIILK
jgi:hypothetical protein